MERLMQMEDATRNSTEGFPYTALTGGLKRPSRWPSPGSGIGSTELPFKGLLYHATRTRGAAYRQ